jgi:pyruvate formate lyase activating enzyme
LIRSIVGTSLIEYPGRISAVIFSGGCNLSCPFCHNPELVLPDLLDRQFSISDDDVVQSLRKRRGFIDAVSVTGGEPLYHRETVDLLGRIRMETGLLVKLDTNGTFPDRLADSLPNVNYVAMDIKTSPGKYPQATGGGACYGDVERSVGIVKGFSDYEFRTTMVPDLVTPDDIREILTLLGPVKRFVIQQFRPGKTLSRSMSELRPYPTLMLEDLAEEARKYASEVTVRI